MAHFRYRMSQSSTHGFESKGPPIAVAFHSFPDGGIILMLYLDLRSSVVGWVQEKEVLADVWRRTEFDWSLVSKG
jgi:hypothetical protein